MTDPTRLNVNLNAECAAVLRDAMSDEGRTATEIVRRALSLYDMARKAPANGERLLIENARGCREMRLL